MNTLGSTGRHEPNERSGQERDIALRHSVAAAEHALASEVVEMSRTLGDLGIELDPLTFVAVKVLDSCGHDMPEAVAALRWLVSDGAVDRSVELAMEQMPADPKTR
jgi:hypothetical protein